MTAQTAAAASLGSTKKAVKREAVAGPKHLEPGHGVFIQLVRVQCYLFEYRLRLFIYWGDIDLLALPSP